MTGQPFDFADRSVVVTGAAGAIGTAVASRFALAGASVTGLDISPGDGIIGCDIMDEASIAQALADVTGGDLVTDLVHCAGAVSV
ncbi:MAG: NAD-dependent epimerase/dehydratase family protein, partial [Streptosporangiaceae bacterium]